MVFSKFTFRSFGAPIELTPFDKVVQGDTDRLVEIARKFLRDDHQARDAVQEALVCLWNQGELPPDPQGWLVTAVVHRSKHCRRCGERRTKHERRAAERFLEAQDADPARQLELDELRARLDRAIAELREEHREAFVLSEIEGLDYQTIAQETAVPIGTVRSRIHRAKQHLQELLRDEVVA